MIKNMITHYKTVNRSIDNYIHNDLYQWMDERLEGVDGAAVKEVDDGVVVMYAGEVVTRITAVADRMEVDGKFSSYQTHPRKCKQELLHEVARSIVIEMSYLEEERRAVERFEELKRRGELELYSLDEARKILNMEGGKAHDY